MKVKIIGAGSVGNHLAQASRRMGWEVSVVDADPKALERMKSDIYPKRYGTWDDSIKLFTPDQEPKGGFDIIMIGTPPDVRMNLALKALEEKPRLLHLEKPLSTPDLAGVKEFEKSLAKCPEILATVGYIYAVSESIEALVELLKKKILGEILTLDVEIREDFRAVFAAHPWLSGPEETYLGYWRRGGGAGGENSHGLHLWQYLAEVAGWGAIKEVKTAFSMKKEKGAEYDKLIAFLFETGEGKVGRVVQDLFTHPFKTWARAQGEKGFVEWHLRGVPEGDLVRWQVEGGDLVEKVFAKKRPDDFWRQALHYQKLLSGEIKPADSPLSFERGLEVMRVLNRAHYHSSPL